VIWATGFSPDWSYVQLPIFDKTGYPTNRRGVTSVPGVYVLGLPWLWTWGSGRFLSVGRDAEAVVNAEVGRQKMANAAE
jgi:putative flavoprotein involved in K+ transport